MKYYLHTLFLTSHSSVSEVMSFDCPVAANKAQEKFIDYVKHKSGCGGMARVIANPPSKYSLFIELVKTNPYGDVNELMNKAEAAIKAIEDDLEKNKSQEDG